MYQRFEFILAVTTVLMSAVLYGQSITANDKSSAQSSLNQTLKSKQADALRNQIPFGERQPSEERLPSVVQHESEPIAQSRGVAIPNDDCANAIRVNVPSVTAGTTIGAALEPMAGPACGTSITTGGVWYSVIGTGNTITATTCGQDPTQPGSASFDSKISVFCAMCESPTCVDGNNNGCGFFFQSTVRWCTDAGTEYFILVHGADAQGTFNLSVYDNGAACADPVDCTPPATGACCFVSGNCIDTTETTCFDAGGEFQGLAVACSGVKCSDLIPVNDECAGAIAISVPSTVAGSTVFATRGNVQSCSVFIDGPGVWYSVIGTGNTMTATTCAGDPNQPGAADFDTKMTVYCGSCNVSSCCSPGNTAGCDDSTCQSAVCTIDPYCCNIEWDSFCVAEAAYACGTLCEPTFCVADNDDGCSTNPLSSTVNWCSKAGQTYFILVHGYAAQTGHFTLSVYDDGEVCDNAISCEPCDFRCTPGSTVEIEPDCGIPSDTVNGGCNSPIGPVTDCCAAHGGGGCSDSSCSDAVCAIDPFCCDETWDLVCADIARGICADCAVIEYRMLPISCGQTYCSTAGANGSTRDVDWYKLVLDEAGLVEVTATCGFPAIFGIIDNFGVDSCDGLSDFVASAVNRSCEPTSVFAELTAGTWYLLIAPATFSPVECQTEYEFTVSCGSLGACCYEDGSCRQDRADDCAANGGTYQGAGVDCAVAMGREVVRTSTPNLDIPDGFANGVYDELVVDESILVNKISVDVEISHTWIADLELRLEHVESQRSAVLWRGACLGSFDIDITFDDDGGEATCGAPANGVVAPLTASGSPLRVFQGINAAGRWRLYVRDIATPDNGNLGSWTLRIGPGVAVSCDAPLGSCCIGCAADCYDADGVVNVYDLFKLLGAWGTAGTCDIAPPGGDGAIDEKDLVELLSSWGACKSDCQETTLSECGKLQGQWMQGGDCSMDPCSP